jgi:RibD C-terminal domain
VTEFVTLDGVAQAPGGPTRTATAASRTADGRQSLLRLGLVDRLHLWLYPLLLGSGKHVFADGTVPTALRLTESVTYPNGTLQLAYETAGAPAFERALGSR